MRFFRLAASFLLSVLCAGICLGSDAETQPMKELTDQWGVEIVNLRTTAEGYMLDFRYRVIDPDKSMTLLDRKTKPYLIDPRNGAKIPVVTSRFGSMRSTTTRPIANRIYTVLFVNPGKSIKKGDKLTVVMGDFKAENVAVN